MTEIQLDGYLALPKSRAGAGVLVLHAWWGLNAFLRDLCKRLAREGLVAFAPDLYHGHVATTIEDAKRLRSKLNKRQERAHILAGRNDTRRNELDHIILTVHHRDWAHVLGGSMVQIND
jgi:carboxymethylenebutenolidase